MSTPTIPVIDVPQALALLKAAVDSKPEGYSYEYTEGEQRYRVNFGKNSLGCRYIGDDGAPRCIVGVALSLHTPLWDKIPTVVVNEQAALLSGDEVATQEAAFLLRQAQRVQDNEGTWALALVAAEEFAARQARGEAW